MDRRFTLWLLLTTSMCLIYLSLRPNQPREAPEAEQAEKAPEDPLAKQSLQAQRKDQDSAEVASNATAEISEDPKPENPRRSPTLGSMDPSKGFHLLFTLSSLGASIEKAEAVEQTKAGEFKYRALEQKGGYLGHLSLTQDMRITAVPDGSPAAAASSVDANGGLKVGDKLLELQNLQMTSPIAYRESLASLDPGTEVTLVVERESTKLTYSATLCEVPLDILRTDERNAESVNGNLARRSLKTTLGSLNNAYIPVGERSFPSLKDTLNANWDVEELPAPIQQELEAAGGQGVQFRLPLASYLGEGLPRKLDLVKRYRLLPATVGDGYTLDVETLIENNNDQAVKASFRQEGVTGMNLEGWWYSVKISQFMFSAAGHRDVVYKPESAQHQLVTTRQIFDRAKEQPNQPDLMIFGEGEPEETRSLAYIGIDSPYFNASLLPYGESKSLSNLRQAACSSLADAETFNRHKIQASNTSFWFDTQEQSIAPGEEISQRYQLFVGPKLPEILSHHGLDSAIEYGWFGFVAKPLSSVLHFFYGIVRNYGIAIILLTIVVRGLMFPLSRNAAVSAQRMQELQPELKKINEQYKDNMEKRAKAMQDLYAKHNFKPLAGCLPMFIQLPIFMGLYRALSVDISLRQAPLVPGIEWCGNLAGPDMMMDWSSWMIDFIAGKGSGWLGPYFNVLPLVTISLFIVQQKMLMPKATDEQTRMTQNMMQFMTIFMGVLFFKVPAGLCIYFVTSSLWSLVERTLVKRTLPKVAKTKTSTEETTPENNGQSKAGKKKRRTAPTEEKPKSRLEGIKEMLEKPAVRSSTQRGPAKGAGNRSNRPKKKKKR